MPWPMQWRLINDGAHTGAWNMALDEALWNRAAFDGTATLRFYGWKPFCLSLGRLQKTLPPLLEQARENSDALPHIVRRPTGGRAVWHAHELTYALAAPLDALPLNAQSVVGAYEWLSRGFVLGLQELGVPVELAPSGVRSRGSNCFAASAGCDFLVEGRKLIGAAQCRDESAFLQHGSLLLQIDSAAWQRFAGDEMHAVSLSELGVEVSGEKLRAALVAGFERATDTRLCESSPDERDLEVAHELEVRKYRAPNWTWKGEWEQTASSW